MAEMHYSEYLNKVRGCIMGLGDMSWIEPALRVVAKSGADFTAMQLADAYDKGGALTPHFLSNMDRGIFPPLAVFDDPEQGGAGGKTASAQTGQLDGDGNEIIHAWFVGFYPAEKPRYAIAVFAEGMESGSDFAAPVFKKICDGIAETAVYETK